MELPGKFTSPFPLTGKPQWACHSFLAVIPFFSPSFPFPFPNSHPSPNLHTEMRWEIQPSGSLASHSTYNPQPVDTCQLLKAIKQEKTL